jgi:type IV pilus assembly protein PilM
MSNESIWKKEISFGRKRKEEAPAESEPTEEQASVWKKEINFGRKKKQLEPEVVAEVSEEPEPPEETWTRAVSFGRKAEPEVAAPLTEEPAEVIAAEPEPVTPIAETPAPVVELPAADTQPETVTVSGTVAETGPVAPVAEAPAPVGEPGPGQPTVEAPTPAEPVWTKEVSFSRAPAPTPEPTPEATPDPTPEPEPVAAAPEPAPGVHAPVTADELPPLDEPEVEKKVPFWKKEIGGKKKAKAGSAPVTTDAAPADDAEPDEKVPFWKKEIGGKKQPKAERTPKQPKAKKEKAPKAPKQRKPKEPKVKAARGSRGAKRITGLKIGASQLAAARVANNGSAELLQVARTSLEPGIVVGGELRDPDALAAALKQFFAANSLPKKGVRLGIANNRIGVRTFEIAGIDDEKQLTNAIRFRAQEALPIPIDEAVLDYHVLGEGTDEQGQPTKRILLVVAYRELIDRYLNACKKAGISLVGIDLEAFALLRVLQAPQDGVGGDSAAALVAVSIGHDRSTFAVSDGRVCEFTRVVEWGGSALNVAIARALDAAPSEVDGVKRALALTDEMVPEGLTDEQAKKARDAMRRAIQTFARELVSSLQYYQNQPGSLGIGEIVLTGGTAQLAGLAGELERLIGVRVRVGDPLARMKVSKKVGEAEQVGSLAVAIGLGIED